MHKPKTGLIGTGKWGSIIKQKLEKNSKLLFTANSQTLFLDKLKFIDWVFVATPDKTHFSLVKKMIKQKKNIFCEKPLTLNYKKSKLLFNIAIKNKTKLYVDNIQSFHTKKIKLFKNNYITRQKKGSGDSKYLLYRFAYHDFYYLYDCLKNKKLRSIKIEDKKKNLKFKLTYNDLSTFNFYYSLNAEQKIHMINNKSFLTKKDLLNTMIKAVLNNKVNFVKNQKQSLFANQLIDKIQKKL